MALQRQTELTQINIRFYDALWRDARLIEAHRLNTWPLIESLLPTAARRLEIASGLNLRLPISGTEFVDLSAVATERLRARGARVARGCATALPFATDAFDLVSALDIIEHVDDDDRALAELTRVLRSDGAVLLSTPLHPQRWTAFDEIAGHARRYEPQQLLEKLGRCGLHVVQSCAFGMEPQSVVWSRLASWFLRRQPQRALWWYHHVGMPIAIRFQAALQMQEGVIDLNSVDEVLLMCRKRAM